MARRRVNAHAVNGAVVSTVDVRTAYAMAAALEAAGFDVVQLRNAATTAAAQADQVNVRFLSLAPSLRLAAAGGDPA